MTCERRAPSRSTALDRACFHLSERTANSSRAEMAKTPTLIWAQRVEKVFVTWECLSTKDVNVTLSEGLLTVEGTAGNGDQYKLETLPLFLEIEPEGSKWFKNDRCATRPCSENWGPKGSPQPASSEGCNRSGADSVWRLRFHQLGRAWTGGADAGLGRPSVVAAPSAASLRPSAAAPHDGLHSAADPWLSR